jgi:ubiquinone/menaquinone biosynthesis C-methylase UbiE
MDIRAYNREAWNRYVDEGESLWTQPFGPEIIAEARNGNFSIVLTKQKPVPREWFPPLQGLDILCLASGGGQQGPVLAAAGANVTVFDNSPRQLDQDRVVAEREGLTNLKTVEGDMRDLSVFEDESFDLIFHPVSNLFIHDVRPVWREAFRVLRQGGSMLAGFMNPVFYMFDIEKADKGILEVKYKLPYAHISSHEP